MPRRDLNRDKKSQSKAGGFGGTRLTLGARSPKQRVKKSTQSTRIDRLTLVVNLDQDGLAPSRDRDADDTSRVSVLERID